MRPYRTRIAIREFAYDHPRAIISHPHPDEASRVLTLSFIRRYKELSCMLGLGLVGDSYVTKHSIISGNPMLRLRRHQNHFFGNSYVGDSYVGDSFKMKVTKSLCW